MEREITLLTAARQMNGNALAEIFELYAPDLYRYAFRLSNHAEMADKLVGEVFEKFVQQLTSGQNSGIYLRAYLFEIAYGILIEDLYYTNFALLTGRGALRSRNQRSAGLSAEDQRVLDMIEWSLLHDLTEDQRHVVLLRFVEGFSLKETAVIIGKKVNNVKVIQNRAIAALRKALDNPVAETHTITLLLRRLAQA
jgi:RNA polymerase sigma-70 factor, ECF subfamily